MFVTREQGSELHQNRIETSTETIPALAEMSASYEWTVLREYITRVIGRSQNHGDCLCCYQSLVGMSSTRDWFQL